MQIIFRRNVYYNERSFPARKQKLAPLTAHDKGEDLLGLQFYDDGDWWTITDFGIYDNHDVLWYVNNKTKEEEKSSVREVREWYNRTQLHQATTHLVSSTNTIQPTRKGYINRLAEEVYNTVKHYNVKLPNNHIQKPTSFKKAGNSPYTQWFQAEAKEKDGMLSFNTWIRLDPKTNYHALLLELWWFTNSGA